VHHHRLAAAQATLAASGRADSCVVIRWPVQRTARIDRPHRSPLLACVYLHRLDWAWRHGEDGVLVRYADDLVVMCRTRGQAEHALARLTWLLASLGLEPKPAKTAIVHLTEGGEGFDFLRFHHRLVRARGRQGTRRVVFLARWPSRKAAQHARDRVRELTDRSRLLVPVDQVMREVNAFLRGWAGYFRYGNSTRASDKIRASALGRLSLFVAKRHKRSRAWDWRLVVYDVPRQLGLISFNGTVAAPRPNRPWRAPAEQPRCRASVSRVPHNRMHGSMGGSWKRNATASPRQLPTRPSCGNGPMQVRVSYDRRSSTATWPGLPWGNWVTGRAAWPG